MYFVMAVRAGAFPCASYPSYKLATFYFLPWFYFYFRHMAVQGLIAIPMIYDYMNTITVSCKARQFYFPITCCVNRGTLRCRKIKTFMHFGRSIYRVNPHAKT